MRTFVAIELSENIRRRLGEAVSELSDLGGRVRWQSPATMHLTLKFIGDMDEKDAPEAVAVLEEVALATRPFVMSVEGLSGFPPHGTPRVVHAPVVEPSGVLEQLQRNVDRELGREMGVERDGRTYIPHVTLGRVKDRRKAPSLEQMKEALADDSFGRMDVTSFTLFKSDLTPEGAVHTPIHEFEFEG